MKKTFVFSMFVILIIFSACAPRPVDNVRPGSRAEQLKNTGLFGQHTAFKFKEETAISGQISGTYFLLAGSINGSISTDAKVAFNWSPKPNTYITSSVPRSKIIVVISQDLGSPQLEFVFRGEWLKDNCPGREAFECTIDESDKEDLNYYIEEKDSLSVVKIRITADQLAKEPALPQP